LRTIADLRQHSRSSSPGPSFPILIVVMLFLATARVILSTQNAPSKPAAAHSTSPSSAISSGGSIATPSSASSPPTNCTSRSAIRASHAHLPHHVLRRHRSQLLGTAPRRQDGPDSKQSQHHVDRSRKTRPLPRPVRAILRRPARQDAAARLCRPRRLRRLGRAQQQQPPSQNANCRAGRAVFEAQRLHQLPHHRRHRRARPLRPDLTHVASRDTIASGSVPNTPENLRAFIDNPAHFKPGVLMPAMHLNEHDLDAVTAYLTR
jgi:cytochrome c oxidase subunit 2